MTDDFNPDLTKAIVTAATSGEPYKDALQPLARQLGKTLETGGRAVNLLLTPLEGVVWTGERIVDWVKTEVGKKIEGTPQDEVVSARVNIAAPAIEAARYISEEPDLQDMFANLLATAIDRRVRQRVPSRTTLKRLFALSGNCCAFPGCRQRIVEGKNFLGDVCHIKADSPGGPRYDVSQSDVERQHFDNLIVLCPNHHKVVDDDPDGYTVEILRLMKSRQETYAPTSPKIEFSDQLGSAVQRAMLTGAAFGAAAGTAAVVAQNVGPVLDWLLSQFFRQSSNYHSQQRAARRQLLNILRYGPKGQMAYAGSDAVHERLGFDLSNVFTEAGWRVQQRGVEAKTRDGGMQFLVIVFALRDENQIPNARRTIDELLERLGFESENKELLSSRRGGEVLRILSVYERSK